ncbi:hypothetical protein GIB67_002892 [Kingdonia uniflora]|uniref:Uncharacterized protein n=1 Tax=Kingdonia uniflora TaxID=39325 RepID=A0A7J7NQD8_9MAGN|nr:hypothetical protein GIB67_002892 [Kingdonia uniflora]
MPGTSKETCPCYYKVDMNSGALANGVYYWWTSCHGIFSFDLENEKSQIIKIPVPVMGMPVIKIPVPMMGMPGNMKKVKVYLRESEAILYYLFLNFQARKETKQSSFLPALEGDSPTILAAYLLNLLRFGELNKYNSNTNIIGDSEKFYTTNENYLPQELDIFTLEITEVWDVNGSWGRPFTSHSKTAP